MALLAHAGTPDEHVTELLVVAGGYLAWTASKGLRHEGASRLSRPAAMLLLAGAVVVVASALVIPATFMKPPRPATIRPASAASLAIDEPTAGEHVSGSAMGVTIELNGGMIVPTSTTKLTPDTGHLHLYIDGRLISMGTDGLRESVPIADLGAGPHRLRVEFVAADHGPFDPRVQTTVAFVKVPCCRDGHGSSCSACARPGS
jgi:hypothetical protein